MTKRFLHTFEDGSEHAVDFTDELYAERCDVYRAMTGPQLNGALRRWKKDTSARGRLEYNAAWCEASHRRQVR